LKPGSGTAFYNRGNSLRELMRFDQALADYDRGIALKADYAEAFHGRGIVLADLERYQEALADYDRAITLKPDYADAFYGRGIALAEMGHEDEAVASYKKAIALAPDQKFAFGAIAFSAMKACDWARRDELCRELRRHVTQQRSIISPFLLLGYDDDPALYLLCAQSYVRDRFGVGPRHIGSGAIRRNEKLRLAYLSGDFRLHAVAFLVAELFERHDRSRFEVIGVSCGP